MFAMITLNPQSPKRPFRVKTQSGTRAFGTLARALTAAKAAMSPAPAPTPSPVPTAETAGPVLLPVERFRVRGRVGLMTVDRIIIARGRAAAVRIFVAETGADIILKTRKLKSPAGKAATVRKTKGARSAKIRRQTNSKVNRIIRRAERATA